jgi:thiol-disulfide isomerase/thioredoxin
MSVLHVLCNATRWCFRGRTAILRHLLNGTKCADLAKWKTTTMKPSWKALASHCVAAAAMATVVRSTPARGGDVAMPPAAATEWLNFQPQTATGLRGKVVVVQFWTFTCINWRRTLPYVRAWDAKYRDQGLIVIGVHTPEFDFEENVQNVRSELAEMHIEYPVAIDNQHAIWNAFHNVYWPALYLLVSGVINS